MMGYVEATYAASNRNTPPDVLAELGQHADNHVRARVARNPSTPYDTLLRMAQSDTNTIRGVIASRKDHMDLLRILSSDPHQTVCAEVAKNDATPPDVLVSIAKNAGWIAACHLLFNPSLPYGIWVRADLRRVSVRSLP